MDSILLTTPAAERRRYPAPPRIQPTVSPRHVTTQPDRRPTAGGGNFTLTIIDCDGGDDVTLNFVNGLLTNDGSASIRSGCGNSNGGGSL